jgi:hypothetical protein
MQKLHMTGEKQLRKTVQKKRKGRPARIDPAIVVGSADTMRAWFQQFWPKLGPRILRATSAEAIESAINEDASSISNALAKYSDMILQIVRDRRFPHAREKSQIQFLADSLGGQGFITARRSREICAKERSKVRYVIVRREFYVECSCGYKGPALDGACRECGTGELSWELRVRDIEERCR